MNRYALVRFAVVLALAGVACSNGQDYVPSDGGAGQGGGHAGSGGKAGAGGRAGSAAGAGGHSGGQGGAGGSAGAGGTGGGAGTGGSAGAGGGAGSGGGTGGIAGAGGSAGAGGTAPSKKNNGDSCSAGSECTSTFCVDGVCCNSQCSGQCQSCSTGTCANVRSARTPCAGSGTCGGVCDGTSPSCVFPAATITCGSTGCMSTTTAYVTGTCNGSGSCLGATTQTCTGGQVCTGTASCACPSTAPALCNGTCVATNTDAHCGSCNPCASGKHCSSGTCIQCLTDNDCSSTDLYGTCQSGSCGCYQGATPVSCTVGGPTCMNWGFESGTAEGWGRDPLSNQGVTNITVSTSHTHTGTHSLAVSISIGDYSANSSRGFSVAVPLCSSGTVSLANYTMSFWVYFTVSQGSIPMDAADLINGQFETSDSSSGAGTNTYIPVSQSTTNQWLHFQSSIIEADPLNTYALVAAEFPIADATTEGFIGTMYLDDVQLLPP